MTASSLAGSRVSAFVTLWLVASLSPVWGPILAPSLLGQEPTRSVRVWEGTLSLPTYAEGAPDDNPPFDYLVSGRFNYPYTIRDNLTDRRSLRAWRALNLENEYLKCVVLPDLGGHLYSCTDKRNGAEVFYANPSIKLTNIAYRGAWAAFGVEFNFPVSHNWMTTSPVDFATTSHPDGSASIVVGNIDRPYGMQWLVELRLHPGRAVLEQHTTLYNRGDLRQRFYWWTNAAVEVWDDSRIIYPMRFTASHGFRDVDTWPVDSRGTDNSVVGNHVYGPVSRFSHGSREAYMAVYHPRTEAGVVHYSSPADLPSKKIWSWGSDPDGLDWRRALSDNESAYVEIQAGLFRDQETYGFLQPGEVIRFSASWVPIRQLGGVTRANPDAVIHLTRATAGEAGAAGEEDGESGGGGEDVVTLQLRVNVTRDLPGATLELLAGDGVIDSRRVALTPADTYSAQYAELPAQSVYTVRVLDGAGTTVLSHTEGVYDLTPADRIRIGAQPDHEFLPVAERSEGEYVALGDLQEREGQRLSALDTYREGLGRFPQSLALNKAAGRLSVALKQYHAAIPYLSHVLGRVSNDREASYYLGHALAATGDASGARLEWEKSQAYGLHRPASLWALAGLSARQGLPEEAMGSLDRLAEESPNGVRGGAMTVALLRSADRIVEARDRLQVWRQVDPTSSHLRYEATRLGAADQSLWCHLAADSERILEIAVDYLRFGLYRDVQDLLSRDYPRGPCVVAEPGMPHPGEYPLIAYYRGYAKSMLGEGGGGDFERASGMPTRYVFPNRPETFTVLERALEHSPDDATAHFLLGSLYLSAGMPGRALEEWQTARQLDPGLPVLHRNMGYTVLRSGGSPDSAAVLFREGIGADGRNTGLYFGLDEAMTLAGHSAGQRADALLAYPDLEQAPAALVYKLARTLVEAGRFDEAEALFEDRFFPRREGGINVREVYLEVRVGRAIDRAEVGECAQAQGIVDRLSEPRPELPFTHDGLEPFIESDRFQGLIGRVTAACPAANQIRPRS